MCFYYFIKHASYIYIYIYILSLSPYHSHKHSYKRVDTFLFGFPSIFLGYLAPKTSLENNSSGMFKPTAEKGDKDVHILSMCICPEVNTV